MKEWKPSSVRTYFMGSFKGTDAILEAELSLFFS